MSHSQCREPKFDWPDVSKVISYRRDLHQIPELGHDLPRTLAYLRQQLEDIGCEVFSPTPASLAVFFDFGQENTLAFRADMDALPLSETSTFEWSSLHPNQMHACGHDAHMAILLGLCQFLQSALVAKESMPHNYLAIFQPAEETTGGAKEICDTNILAEHRVVAVFGLHMWPGLPTGAIYARPGPQMARSSEITIRIYGRSTHIAKLGDGPDALYAAALLASRAIKLEQTSFPPQVRRLLRFGRLDAGTAQNVIAGSALLRGTLRAFTEEVYNCLRNELTKICEQVSQETNCQIELDVSEGFPPVCNDPDLFAKIQQDDSNGLLHLLAEPHLTAEDFSFYQQQCPGVFFFLGTGKNAPLHTQHFDLDERALESGLEFLKFLTGLRL